MNRIVLGDGLTISHGYVPGLIGRVVELHASYYANAWGFGAYFEARVARDLSAFMMRYNAHCDRIWWVELDGVIHGSLTVDGYDDGKGDGAHFRWFVLSDELRGKGLGNRLMDNALAFCGECGFPSAYLWTFAGLDTARQLYEKAGFECRETHTGDQWGISVQEQRFTLSLAKLAP
jgi:GNAT superfamily N-acetyltransferase